MGKKISKTKMQTIKIIALKVCQSNSIPQIERVVYLRILK